MKHVQVAKKVNGHTAPDRAPCGTLGHVPNLLLGMYVGNKEFGLNNNLANYGRPTPPSGFSRVDYGILLDKSTPLFIGSPVGISIYSPNKVGDYQVFPYANLR